VFSSKAMQCKSGVIVSFAISVTTIVAWYLSDMVARTKFPSNSGILFEAAALTMKIYS